ncbi:MAG: CAP domain-containing protein [Nitriliruptor sp.]|nr:MAG: CAP domain-containing protein [Nitriliruptor sp.]
MIRTLTDLRRWLVAAGLILLFLMLDVQMAPPADAAVLPAAEAEFLCNINAERQEVGLPGLRVVAELTDVARAHSGRMADASLLYHNPNLASEVSNWRVLAENVGRGHSVGSLHQALMESRGHRANILNTSITEVGVGVEARGSTLWVTQVFRQHTGGASGQLPACGATAASGATAVPAAVPVRGDWNGDGFETPGWFENGRWRLSNGLEGAIDLVFDYGRAGDLPVVGDWNGSGQDTVGVVRDDTWLLRDDLSGGAAHRSFRYGRVTRGDVPIVGNWNGDRHDTIGIIRDGEWHLRHSLSGGPGQTVFTYGRLTRGDIALIGDWNADGRDTVGIVRDGEWHLRNSLSGGPGQIVFTYGRVLRGDVPVIGDWNGTGRSGVGIVRDADWHLRNTLSGGPAEHVVRFR